MHRGYTQDPTGNCVRSLYLRSSWLPIPLRNIIDLVSSHWWIKHVTRLLISVRTWSLNELMSSPFPKPIGKLSKPPKLFWLPFWCTSKLCRGLSDRMSGVVDAWIVLLGGFTTFEDHLPYNVLDFSVLRAPRNCAPQHFLGYENAMTLNGRQCEWRSAE